MISKRYMLTVVNTSTERIHSTVFGKIDVFIISMLSIVSFLILSYLTSRYMHNLQIHQQTKQLKKENIILKQNLTNWEIRTKNIESTLMSLQKRNKEIRIAAALPSEPIAYGIGGPELSTGIRLVEFPEFQKTEMSLFKLESEVEHLKNNMKELESLTETHKKQIAHYPSIRPVRRGWLSSDFGERIDPFTGQIEKHHAIDISVKPGTEVFASAAGIIEVANTHVIKNKGYGKFIIIDHGYGYKTIYAHLSAVYVTKGQQIKRWDLIGLSGSTGKSTAPHIHYEVLVNNISQNPIHFFLE